MTEKRPHALYRFFDAAGELLYIGITFDPGSRWRAHRDDKPWWSEIAKITVETFADRDSVLAAEKNAILAERPKYNVIHNQRISENRTVEMPQQTRMAPIQPGDWVAIGLNDGRAPVGAVEAIDDTWIAVRLVHWSHGHLTEEVEIYRVADVVRMVATYMEDHDDEGVPTDHLVEFQGSWRRMYHGEDGLPLYEAARRAYAAWARVAE